MLKSTDARLIINNRIKSFPLFDEKRINWTNQPNFKIPLEGLWARVTIQYSDSQSAGFFTDTLERDYGIISIQCFARKGTWDTNLIAYAQAWRDHFKHYRYQDFEVTMTNAPTEAMDDVQGDFVMSLTKIEFRVN
jgi:hypothetical protein